MEQTIKEAISQTAVAQLQEEHPSTDIVNLDDVQLTEDEVNEAIAAALNKKRSVIREQMYWDRVRKPKIYPKLNADEMFRFALTKAKNLLPDFELDEKNNTVFSALAYYFAGDKTCEQFGLSLNKGICLIGPVGCGKTIMMRCFASNPTNSFREISARHIANEYMTNGNFAIEYYSGILPAVDSSLFFGQKEIGLFIDDFGTEDNKKHFGNEINVLENILLNRYDNPYLKTKTHMTTNLSGDDIEEFYGLRVRSRIREMFNWITFDVDSPDRRK